MATDRTASWVAMVVDTAIAELGVGLVSSVALGLLPWYAVRLLALAPPPWCNDEFDGMSTPST